MMRYFFLFLLLPGLAYADYYVATDGSNSDPGTLAEPFLTIAQGSSVVTAGETIYIRAGTYTERINPSTSGTSGNLITYQNYNDETVIIDADALLQGVLLLDVSYIKIKGLQVKNSTHAGIHIHNHLDDPDTGSDYNVIEGNTISYCGTDGYSGIYIGGYYNQVINNTSINNGDMVTPKDHGIYLMGNNNTISGNHCSDNARMGIRSEGEDNVIRSNVLADNGETGISIWSDSPLSADGFIIDHNLIIGHPEHGITINGDGTGTKPTNIEIYNNTIDSDSGENGIRIINEASNITLKNNVVLGTYSIALIGTDGTSVTGYVEDYNLFYGTGDFAYNNTPYSTYSAYQIASSQGANSFNETADLDGNYKPNTGSVVIEAGVDVSLDYTGTAPTIGAYEYPISGASFVGGASGVTIQ